METRRTPRGLGLLALAPLLTLACFMAGDGMCPCGSDPDAPVSEHDPAYSGMHTVSEECVCQCGEEADLFGTPRRSDGTCSADGEDCETEAGEPASLACY